MQIFACSSVYTWSTLAFTDLYNKQHSTVKACSNEANIVQYCWANNVARLWTKILLHPTMLDDVGPTMLDDVGPTMLVDVGPSMLVDVGPSMLDDVGPTCWLRLNTQVFT